MHASPWTGVRLDDLTGLTPLAATTASHDPGPIYATLREAWGPVAPVELSDGVPAWLVLDYADVVRVLRDPATFTRNVARWRAFSDGRVRPGTGLHAFFSPRSNAYYTDGDQHTRLRAVVDDTFERVDERLLAREVRRACDRILDDVAPHGTADLVPSYTALVPALTVAAMYGLGPERAADMLHWASDIFSGTERAMPAFLALNTMLQTEIDCRRVHPTGDVLSTIVHHPAGLNATELLDTAQMIQSAGHEMSVAWTTTTLAHLLADANFAGRVAGGRLGVDEALNAVLVHVSPTWNTPCRFATADAEIAGRTIRRGDAVVTAVAEATHSVHRDADQIWSADSRAHLAFGAGPHRCPADRLSRIIVKVAVEQVLIRLPGLRLTVPADELGYGTSLWSRSAPQLPVTFQPTRSYMHPRRSEGLFQQ
ncbi:cytochrome P450 [Myceligenerans salitolerans]|uniref:Cytochrome P450 n=1 Tax=Myceligenerans salitolerans TaxID=1230528 RepID=A0ABS3IA76_9MICO|nr:cytochrome P450 [Myceligenerans salitolerans]MBO0609900.1 cytochrome P450 [Myceligenerans salitolerans]